MDSHSHLPHQTTAAKIWRLLRVYVMPAAVFQSVVVGGGYGTGREVVEFFSNSGPVGGLAGIGVATLYMCIVLALTFELSRLYKSYDYRHFFKTLLGRGWFLYELLFVAILMIVLAIVLSASSTLLFDSVGVPKLISMISILAIVCWAVYSGTAFVERILSIWAAFVSIFLIAVLAIMIALHGGEISQALSRGDINSGWWLSAGQFALYNLSVAPALLYAISDIKTRHEAFISGCIAAIGGMLPAFAMHVTFLGKYPQILSEALPMFYIVHALAIPGLMAIYMVILLGTIIQTAIGALQGLADRLDGWLQESRKTYLGARGRALLSGGTLVGSSLLSTVGIVDLVARGYGTMAWGFLMVYVLPLITIGVWKILHAEGQSQLIKKTSAPS